MRHNPTTEEINVLVRVWLGSSARVWYLPSNTHLVSVLIQEITGHKCSMLLVSAMTEEYQLSSLWGVSKLGFTCPRCQKQIRRRKRDLMSGRWGTSVFCDCIRLTSAKLPPLEFLFRTWNQALAVVDYALEAAEYLERKSNAKWARQKANWFAKTLLTHAALEQ
jgi:hypothetical protein